MDQDYKHSLNNIKHPLHECGRGIQFFKKKAPFNTIGKRVTRDVNEQKPMGDLRSDLPDPWKARTLAL